MSSPRRFLRFFPSPSTLAVTAVALAALTWAGYNAGPARTDLAAVQQNGCQVVAGNGKVVTQPSANCPVSIALSGPLSVPASAAAPNIAPGDTINRRLVVTNDGKNTLESIVMDAAPSSSPLNGSLRLTVKRCSVAWSNTNTCSGTTATLANGVTLPRTGLNLGSSPAKNKGGQDHLLVSIQLLDSAGSSLEGASTTMTYKLTATKN